MKTQWIKYAAIGITAFAMIGSSMYLSKCYSAQEKRQNHETVYDRIESHKIVSYLVIGDSIGRGSGASNTSQKWFKQLEDKMQRQLMVNLKGNYIVQSGSTAFEGLYKLQLAKQSYPGKYDLIFIVFGENDRKYMNAHEFSIMYEALLRQAKKDYPKADVITITESPLDNKSFINSIETLSAYYQATNVNMAEAFRQSGKKTEELSVDGIHPNDEGYQIYADQIYKALLANTVQKKKVAALTIPLYKDSDITFDLYSDVSKQKGFLHQNHYYTAQKKGSYIEFAFYGSMLGMKLLRSPEGGKVNIYIDNQYTTTISTWWPFQRERFIYITSGLNPGKHTVRFEATGESSKKNMTNQSIIQLSSVIMTKKWDGKSYIHPDADK
ncbi:GDSL-type esterase/lipase family protein [Bacillus sp. 1P06AnD]|uniref:GDSL-type esterase/lipase family protein n=1 Tax=Bacillus sp. 1P06AnD TaxID=3132208 RepID=UPI0039A37E44